MDIHFYNPDASKLPGRRIKKGFNLPLTPLLVILLVLGLLSFWFKFPAELYPNAIKGDFMDLALNPDGTVWVLTDGSFKYIMTVSRPGYHSTGVRGADCKTFLYLYDPQNKKVLKKITNRYKELPRQNVLVRSGQKLWQVSTLVNEPFIINQYNAATGTQLLNTASFIAEYPELKPGIAELNFRTFPDRLWLKTRSGLKYEYLLASRELLPDQAELIKSRIAERGREQGLRSLFLLVNEASGGGDRKLLYRAEGSAYSLVSELIYPTNRTDYGIIPSYFGHLSFAERVRVTLLTTGEVFLEPFFVYQDQELSIILTQDQVGKEAKRRLVCVNADGAIRWTAAPDQLFNELMVRKENSLSTTFFVKGRARGERQGDFFALKVEDLGAIGFDVKSGKKLWQIRL